jgi:hypothetical protein
LNNPRPIVPTAHGTDAAASHDTLSGTRITVSPLFIMSFANAPVCGLASLPIPLNKCQYCLD